MYCFHCLQQKATYHWLHFQHSRCPVKSIRDKEINRGGEGVIIIFVLQHLLLYEKDICLIFPYI